MAKRIFLFVVTNIAIVFTLSIILSLLGAGRYISPDGSIDYTQLAVFCFVWGMGGSFISLQLSRWTAKRAMGVQLVNGQTGTQDLDWLYNTVGQLTRQANLPMPEVGVYDSPEVNAFATGPSKRRSLVACSTGLLRNMSREEIQGVINAFVMFFARLVAFGVRSTSDSRNSYMLSYLVMIVLEIGLGILGSLITAWYSRQREFRADYGGATLAGKPHMLGALRRLAANHEAVDTSHQALATLKINGSRGWMVFFSTHPPLEQRIAALERAQIA